MTSADHCSDMFFPGRSIRRLICKRADPPFAGEGDGSFGRAIGDRRGNRGAIILVDPSMAECAGNSARAQPAPRHCARARFAKRPVINVTG